MAKGSSKYRFDQFTLDAESRLLTGEAGSVIDITPRAAEILCILVENAGQLVTREELMRSVWPDSFVEEANLSHHIFKLRKALGETADRKLIETVPKRGYRFVAPLRDVQPTATADAVPADEAHTAGGRRSVVWLGAGLLVLVFGIAGWLLYSRMRSTQPPAAAVDSVKSIAVMPFVNESGNDDVEYLSNGMTETLINSLSEIPSLRVKSRPAVFKYKGRNIDHATLASELNVETILFGRLTQRGNDLTLFLSLIDPETENQIWGKQYVRKLSDLVALQSEIGRDVAQSLESKLNPAAADRLARRYSMRGDAYRLYLLGDYHWAKFTKENLLRAKKYYEEAIAIDPDYALAYTGLSAAYSALGVNGHIPASEARRKARESMVRALELDPQLAEANMASGAYKMFFEWDLEGADADFRRAMELDADYAVPHELIAFSLRARGRHEEAIAEAKRANELDPLNLLMLGDIAVCYRFAGRLDEAIQTNNRLFEMDPNFGDARFENGLVLSQLGDQEKAFLEVTRAVELTEHSTKIRSGVGIVHARAGRTAEAQKVIGQLLEGSKRGVYVSPMDIALIYSAMNEKDKAIEWLEKAYNERTPWLFEINVTPELYPLRDDPRFAELARRVGL